jgi:hypothetical protein
LDQENEEYMKIQTAIRKDIVEALGSDMERTFNGLQNHMMEAVSCTLTIHLRFHCIGCMQERLFGAFFTWLNGEGSVHVLKENYEYTELCSEATRWALAWVNEQMLSPCTDDFPSTQVH